MSVPPPKIGERAIYFPTLSPRVFLNHAAVSPPSSSVQAAIRRCLEDYAREGVDAVMPWWQAREALRTRLSAFIGGSTAQEIAFVQNTSSGVTGIAQCLKWQAGDRIILFDQEFPTNIVPWQRAAASYDLELEFVSTEETISTGGANLKPVLERGARLVAASFVQFQTGWRMPLERIAELSHDAGAELFVDAIQGLGVMPFDVGEMGIDYVSCGGHKWLMGVEGAGFVWVAERAWDNLEPRLSGWLSTEEPLKFLFEGPGELRYDRPIKREPAFLEFGATNALGYAALDAAVETLETLKVARIWEHVSHWQDALVAGLDELGLESTFRPDARSGIVSILPPADLTHLEVKDALAAQGIAVSTPDGLVRFAPHWPNSLDEVPVVLNALQGVLARVSTK